MSGEFLIYFDGVMWIGLFSVEKDGRILRIGKFIFGAEPSSAEVYEWLREGAPGLFMRDVSESETRVVKERVKNPKRVLREVRKSQSQSKESHAQKCMREQVELLKKSSQKSQRELRREKEQFQFEMRMEKKKQKLRGH